MTNKQAPKTPYNKNKKLIQLIHIGKAKLCLDDETYRSLLESTVGKPSTTVMSFGELNQVLARLKQLGFTPTTPIQAKVSAAEQPPSDPQSRLIRHLWLSLYDLGEIRDPSETALNNYIKNQTVGYLSHSSDTKQKSAIIERLKRWLTRVEREQKPAQTK